MYKLSILLGAGSILLAVVSAQWYATNEQYPGHWNDGYRYAQKSSQGHGSYGYGHQSKSNYGYGKKPSNYVHPYGSHGHGQEKYKPYMVPSEYLSAASSFYQNHYPKPTSYGWSG